MRHGLPTQAGFAHSGRNDVQHVPRGAAVAITIEPGGGSRRPTGPVILRTETA
jgi:anti-sigma-K factor RskA